VICQQRLIILAMSVVQFLRSNKSAIAVNATASTIAGLALYVIAILSKGAPVVWQWTMRHPTVVFTPLVFASGILVGLILKRSPHARTAGTSGLRLDRVANVFWLGNDLRYSREMAQYSERQNIVHGLKQASHHSSEVGLSSTPAATMLREIAEEAARCSEKIDEPVRARLGKKILSVTQAFSEILKKYQPDFSPDPPR
jgi:hypothetical protein